MTTLSFVETWEQWDRACLAWDGRSTSMMLQRAAKAVDAEVTLAAATYGMKGHHLRERITAERRGGASVGDAIGLVLEQLSADIH